MTVVVLEIYILIDFDLEYILSFFWDISKCLAIEQC